MDALLIARRLPIGGMEWACSHLSGLWMRSLPRGPDRRLHRAAHATARHIAVEHVATADDIFRDAAGFRPSAGSDVVEVIRAAASVAADQRGVRGPTTLAGMPSAFSAFAIARVAAARKSRSQNCAQGVTAGTAGCGHSSG